MHLYGHDKDSLRTTMIPKQIASETRACEWMNTRWLSNIKFLQMYCFAMNIYTENIHFGRSSFVVGDAPLQLCGMRRHQRPAKRKRTRKRTICCRHFDIRDKQTLNGFPCERECNKTRRKKKKNSLFSLLALLLQTDRNNYAEVLLYLSTFLQSIILISEFLLNFMRYLLRSVFVYLKFHYFQLFYLLSLAKSFSERKSERKIENFLFSTKSDCDSTVFHLHSYWNRSLWLTVKLQSAHIYLLSSFR